ncbi:MAG: hypothetical protein WBO74_17115, partial [Thermoanaerobaculia bacterium]
LGPCQNRSRISPLLSGDSRAGHDDGREIRHLLLVAHEAVDLLGLVVARIVSPAEADGLVPELGRQRSLEAA